MTNESSVSIIIPMKPLILGKTRLASFLPSTRRMALSLLMLERMFRNIFESNPVAKILIIGGDSYISYLAAQWNVLQIRELGQDLNSTIRRAFDQCRLQGYRAVLYLPGDLPFITASDMQALFEASDDLRSLVLSPANRDNGTNALLVPTNIPFQPMLGNNSFNKHLDQAKTHGWPYSICRREAIEFDLDHREDFDTLGKFVPNLREILVSWESFLCRQLPHDKTTAPSSRLLQ